MLEARDDIEEEIEPEVSAKARKPGFKTTLHHNAYRVFRVPGSGRSHQASRSKKNNSVAVRNASQGAFSNASAGTAGK